MSQTEMVKGVPRREYHAKWYQDNKERILARMHLRYKLKKNQIDEYNKKWRAANREKVNEWSKANRAKDPQKFRDRVRASYYKHKEKRNSEKVQYFRENKHVVRLAFHKRRALIAGASIDTSGIREFVSRIYDLEEVKCYYCKCIIPTKEEIHFDHIVPLSRGGMHCLGNLCVACRSCNCRKSYKTVDEWITQGQKLLPL